MPAPAWAEVAASMFEPPEPNRWETPGKLAVALDPTTRQTPALDVIDQVLVDVEAGRCDRLIISMPPQEGKSTRVTKTGPLWMLLRNPERRVAIVSYDTELATEFGRDIRAMITNNQGEDGTLDLGLRISPDNGAAGRWRLANHRGGVRSVGMAAGLTGRPADILFIDDPVKNRAEAESEAFRTRAKSFWTSTAGTRLAPGAPVILVLTRWHEDDLAGWLLGREDGPRWRVINIPAQADHDPSKGQTDPLGREPGEFMISARVNERTGLSRSAAEWEAIRIQAGSRDWAALYQGRPAPTEGGLVKRDWWRYYPTPLWIELPDGTRRITGFDDVLQSWDMAFKDTDSSDYVVGQVWGRIGADMYLLDQVRGRWDFPETVRQVKALTAKWPDVLLKLIEDKANGTAVIATLQRSIGGIVPENPTESKIARVQAVSPLIEAHNVHLPDPSFAPWVVDFVEEWAGFPNAAHDDQVDPGSQALKRLGIMPFLASAGGTVTDEYDDLDELRGWSISPV